MSLQNIIEEMKSLQTFANEDVETGAIETMNGRRGRKNQAIQRLSDLRREYSENLLQSAVFIIVAGAKRDEFAEIATGEKFGLYSSDPESFYSDLANRVHPTLYTKNASPSNLFDILGRHLEDKMRELGIEQYNQLIFKEKYISSVTTAEEFSQVVKVAINDQIGSEIVGIQAANSIVDKAIKNGHSAKTTPIVLSTGDSNLALLLASDLGRLTQRVFLVNAGKSTKELRAVEEALNLKEVSEDSVKATLDTIKATIRK